MTSQLPRFWCLFLSCQQQTNTKNGAAVMSLRSFLFRDDFSHKLMQLQTEKLVMKLLSRTKTNVFEKNSNLMKLSNKYST